MPVIYHNQEINPGTASVAVYGPIPMGKEAVLNVNVATLSKDPTDVSIFIGSLPVGDQNFPLEAGVRVYTRSPLLRTGEPIGAGESIFVKTVDAKCFVRISGFLKDIEYKDYVVGGN